VVNGDYKALNKVQYIAKENIDIKETTVSIQGADSDNRVKLNVNEVLDIDSISAQKLPKLKLC
jgi:hypothetical protein